MNVFKKAIGFGLCLFLLMGCVGAEAPRPAAVSGTGSMLEKYLAEGAALEQKGNLTDALDKYRLALTVDKTCKAALEKKSLLESALKKKADAYYAAGLDYEKTGRESDARKAFLSALQNWPDHSDARRKLTPGLVMDTGNFVIHTIASGESISKLAKLYYGNYKKYPVISLFNHMKDPTRIVIGQKVSIPEIDGTPLSSLQEIQAAYLARVPGSVKESAESDATAQEFFQYEQEMSDVADHAGTRFDTAVEKQKLPEPGKTPAEKTLPAASSSPAVKTASVAPAREEQPDYLSQGKEYFDQKQYKDAIYELRKAADASPDDKTVSDYLFRAHFQYGLALFNMQDFLSARDNFEAAYQVNQGCKNCPEYVQKCLDTYNDHHYTRGIVFFGKEQLKEAIKEWEKVEAIDPGYKNLSSNLKKARLLNDRLETIKQGKTD